ncbi:unnamed protein product [marine sediment metagenome]|uniref:Uncharacterized protein n=1 Tax=marine sediment metagenome TaxID=412755 RepID=X1GR08_9ZZZZ
MSDNGNEPEVIPESIAEVKGEPTVAARKIFAGAGPLPKSEPESEQESEPELGPESKSEPEPETKPESEVPLEE